MSTVDFAIVGAGISGLASAWFLREAGYSVRVLESADYLGGSIRSERSEGFLVEAGPNSTLENTDALGELIRGVGLQQEVLEANEQAKKRYILKQGELLPLPVSPLAFFRTPLFSAKGKLRLLAEPFFGRARSEETIASFVRRRLGPEFLDWAIDPFISGVYAGDPEQLSVQAATRKIYALEAEYGSLFIGALRRLLAGRRSGPAPSGRMISFRDGMQAFPLAIAHALGNAVESGVVVSALTRIQGEWQLHADGLDVPVVRARQVVLCVPAYHAADLLHPLMPDAAAQLRRIEYPAVASVAMGFHRQQIDHPLDGFGFLIPGKEPQETLGSLFSSTLFPGRAPEGQVLLTSFIGGARNRTLGDTGQHALVQRVYREIAPILGISSQPVFSRVNFWRHAIPQYKIGHLRLLEQVSAALSHHPGLHLRANWIGGISLADCVRNAREFSRHARAV
jgi:oxygen-dependent protoporphyrinogen oxidase